MERKSAGETPALQRQARLWPTLVRTKIRRGSAKESLLSPKLAGDASRDRFWLSYLPQTFIKAPDFRYLLLAKLPRLNPR